MARQGHVTTGQVRSSQVLLRSVKTGKIKSRSGQVRSDPVTFMTWSRQGHIRSGQDNVRLRSGAVMTKSGHVRSYQDPVRSSEDQVKIKHRTCQVRYKSEQVRSNVRTDSIKSYQAKPCQGQGKDSYVWSKIGQMKSCPDQVKVRCGHVRTGQVKV